MHQKTHHNSATINRRVYGWVVVLAALFGMPAYAQQALLAPHTVAPAPAGNEATTAVDGALPKEPLPKEAPLPVAPSDEPAPVKSLFFTQDEMAAIHRALTIYAKYEANPNSNEGEDFLKQLEGKKKLANEKQQKIYYTYPQFFLESLTYHSPGDWTIRVNQQRITTKTPPNTEGSIRVLEIDKDKVSFEWKPDEMDMTKISESPNKVPDERVDIDRTGGIIVFTLRANQTFSAYAMRVLEGKVQPVTVKNALADNKPSTPDSTPPTPPAPVPGRELGTRSGLSGLINSYKTLNQEP